MYRVYLRKPDEIRGHGILDLYSLDEAREELEGMEFPEGSFVYIRYGRPGYYEGKRPDKPIEAYKVEGGQLVKIFSRYKGGEWPESYRPSHEERREINKEIEEYLGKKPSTQDIEEYLGYFKERRRLDRRLGQDIKEESKRRWLEEEAGTTHPRPAEESLKFSRLRKFLRMLEAEPEEWDEALREFGKKI